MEAAAVLMIWTGIFVCVFILILVVRSSDERGIAIGGWISLVVSTLGSILLVESLTADGLLVLGAVAIPAVFLPASILTLRAGLELTWNLDERPRLYGSLRETLQTMHPLVVLSAPIPLAIAGISTLVAAGLTASWGLAYLALTLLSLSVVVSCSLTFLFIRSQPVFDVQRWMSLAAPTPGSPLDEELSDLLRSDDEDSRLAAVLLISWADVRTGAQALSELRLQLRESTDERTRQRGRAVFDDIEGSGLIRRAIGPTYEVYLELLRRALSKYWMPDRVTAEVQEVWQSLPRRVHVTLRLQRVFDFCLALVLFGLFHPLVTLLAWLSGLAYGPQQRFFVTTRLGRYGQAFPYIRLNVVGLDSSTGLTWISGYGSFLLRSGLDRVPALTNVLTGELSFVGPMPLSLASLDRLIEDSEEAATTSEANDVEESADPLERLAVPPGLTGPSQQIARREEKAHRCADYGIHDVSYVRRLGFLRDLGLLLFEGGVFISRIPLHAISAGVAVGASGGEHDEGGPTRDEVSRAKRAVANFVEAMLTRATDP